MKDGFGTVRFLRLHCIIAALEVFGLLRPVIALLIVSHFKDDSNSSYSWFAALLLNRSSHVMLQNDSSNVMFLLPLQEQSIAPCA